jgi:hypothetical protein
MADGLPAVRIVLPLFVQPVPVIPPPHIMVALLRESGLGLGLFLGGLVAGGLFPGGLLLGGLLLGGLLLGGLLLLLLLLGGLLLQGGLVLLFLDSILHGPLMLLLGLALPGLGFGVGAPVEFIAAAGAGGEAEGPVLGLEPGVLMVSCWHAEFL